MKGPPRRRRNAPSAGAFVAAKLLELDADVAETAPRVLRGHGGAPDGGEPEIDEDAVHDLRVGIRRLRTLLKLSRDLFGPWHTGVVRDAFAEVMRATGELRDEEVLDETLEGAASGPEFEAWLEGRRAREAELRRDVVLRLERGDLDRARLLLRALLAFPVAPGREVPLARFAHRAAARAAGKVEAKRAVDVEDAPGMHALRIAYKELRYATELLGAALPIEARAQLGPAAVFQKRLGEIHDVDVALAVVERAAELPPACRREARAALVEKRARRVAKYLRELDPLAPGERTGRRAKRRAGGRARPAANARAEK